METNQSIQFVDVLEDMPFVQAVLHIRVVTSNVTKKRFVFVCTQVFYVKPFLIHPFLHENVEREQFHCRRVPVRVSSSSYLIVQHKASLMLHDSVPVRPCAETSRVVLSISQHAQINFLKNIECVV